MLEHLITDDVTIENTKTMLMMSEFDNSSPQQIPLNHDVLHGISLISYGSDFTIQQIYVERTNTDKNSSFLIHLNNMDYAFLNWHVNIDINNGDCIINSTTKKYSYESIFPAICTNGKKYKYLDIQDIIIKYSFGWKIKAPSLEEDMSWYISGYKKKMWKEIRAHIRHTNYSSNIVIDNPNEEIVHLKEEVGFTLYENSNIHNRKYFIPNKYSHALIKFKDFKTHSNMYKLYEIAKYSDKDIENLDLGKQKVNNLPIGNKAHSLNILEKKNQENDIKILNHKVTNIGFLNEVTSYDYDTCLTNIGNGDNATWGYIIPYSLSYNLLPTYVFDTLAFGQINVNLRFNFSQPLLDSQTGIIKLLGEDMEGIIDSWQYKFIFSNDNLSTIINEDYSLNQLASLSKNAENI